MKTNNFGMPDPLASNEEKLDPAYGKQVADFIASEWFGGVGFLSNGCLFMDRKKKIRDNRKFIRGEEDSKDDKNHMSRGDHDLDYLNVDWEKLNLGQKFVRIVSNGIQDDSYKIDVRAFDRLAAMKKQDRIRKLRGDMVARPMLEKAKEVLGIDLTPKGFVPEDEEELQIQIEINERPAIEVAEEITIDFVKRTSDFRSIEEQKNKDLVENGMAAGRVYTDPYNGVQMAYVDIENFGHSFVQTNDFKKAYYFFEVDTITINDLKRESGFDEMKLRKIAEMYGTRSNTNTYGINFNECNFQDLITVKVHVMRFCFKSTKTLVYKQQLRNGRAAKVSKQDSTFDPLPNEHFRKISKTMDTWYEGVYVVGAREMYNYQECENLVKNERNDVRPPYVVKAYEMYENVPRSFLDDIKPICRQLQRQHLKIQQLVAELKPDIVHLDMDQLAELDDGKGGEKKENWKVALSLLNVKGVVITQRIDTGETGIKDGAAARPQAISQGSALGPLLNTWAFYYNLIRDITGVNPARDGSLPADALVGVNQLAQLASNTATRHIVEAAVGFNLDLYEITSSRVHAIFKHKEAATLRKMYEQAVGKENFSALEALQDRGLHEFGFSVELVPSKQELDEFREDLNLALQDGSIDVEVKIEAQYIARRNTKHAREYLKYKRKKRMKQKQEEEMMMAREKSQNDIAANTAATQNKINAYKEQIKLDLMKEAQLSQIRLAEAEALQQIQLPADQAKFQQDVYMEKVKSMTLLERDQAKEDAKDVRLDRQATQNSRMIQQRKSDAPAIDFQSETNFEDIFSLK